MKSENKEKGVDCFSVFPSAVGIVLTTTRKKKKKKKKSKQTLVIVNFTLLSICALHIRSSLPCHEYHMIPDLKKSNGVCGRHAYHIEKSYTSPGPLMTIEVKK